MLKHDRNWRPAADLFTAAPLAGGWSPARRAFKPLVGDARPGPQREGLLEGREADLLASALGGLGIAAFICDRSGAVRATTPQADAVLRRGLLTMRHGRLTANGSGAAVLEAAVEQARSSDPPLGGPGSSPVVLARDEDIEVIDIVALPDTPQAFGFEPRVLVVARGARVDGAIARVLIQTTFDLTPTEAAIALQLAEGESTDDIAADRTITVATLRSHIKAIFYKVGVNRRAELAARLRAFR